MVTSSTGLDRVRRQHQLRSFRIASILRIGVVVLMVGAMLVGTARRDWPHQSVLLVVYALTAICALAVAFSPTATVLKGQRAQLAFTSVDVVMLTGFQLLSTGGYVPLLVMGLLPILVGMEVSWRRAAIVLAITVVAFVVTVVQDPVMERQLGWPETFFLFGLYGFLCATALIAVRVEQRHANSIAGLSALREELLSDTMTASDQLQRRISESLHDGPLQDVLVARQELLELATTAPREELDRALATLDDASKRLREVTFELHPAVLGQVGLGAAVEQLAAFTAQRSGIAIETHVDYPMRSTFDSILFGVVRELLSNMVRHSRASRASVELRVVGHTCFLDVWDNGIGMTTEAAARRLGEGHIGLASHRARVEAAGGRLTLVDATAGTHLRVELPLRSPQLLGKSADGQGAAVGS